MVYIIGSGPVEVIGDIIQTIQNDKNVFRKNRDNNALDRCRLILGEIQRDPNKDTSDENIIKILRQLRKQTLKHPEPDILLVQMIDTYIPPPVSDDEVKSWLYSAGYTQDVIRGMGKKAYSIIGEAKRHFNGRDFNVNVIKFIIDDVIDDIVAN
jgi:uncharacterized protein YqeY